MVRGAYHSLVAALSFSLGVNASHLRAEPVSQNSEFDAAIQRDFIEGMNSYGAHDYRHAESMFRRILDRNPGLLRVRLELARTLFVEKRDEQAEYQFRLAAAADPPRMVARNIVRFREAIRARRSWRFNVDVGFAPDNNINSATDKQTVDIYGLPFRLNPTGRRRSGIGMFAGGDASARLNRFGGVPIYLGAYGRWTHYRDDRFDDVYAGVEGGPEFRLAGGRMRSTVTGLKRWYGRHLLVTSFGAHFDYEKLFGNKWTTGGTFAVRHNDYAQRRDVDGWDAEGRISASRPIGATTLAFVYLGIERDWALDRGQAFWRAKLGMGMVKEIGWGLRPQLAVDLARQVGDGPLAPFGKERRDWLLQGTASIYKRDWNVRGFAPSLSLTLVRNHSTLTLYQERRVRGEIRLTKAF